MPSTDKQLAARRASSLRSTGPSTDKGKAVSSLNGLRHSLRSSLVLIHGEDVTGCKGLTEGFIEAFAPSDSLEASFVEPIIHLACRPFFNWIYCDIRANDRCIPDVREDARH